MSEETQAKMARMAAAAAWGLGNLSHMNLQCKLLGRKTGTALADYPSDNPDGNGIQS